MCLCWINGGGRCDNGGGSTRDLNSTTVARRRFSRLVPKPLATLPGCLDGLARVVLDATSAVQVNNSRACSACSRCSMPCCPPGAIWPETIRRIIRVWTRPLPSTGLGRRTGPDRASYCSRLPTACAGFRCHRRTGRHRRCARASAPEPPPGPGPSSLCATAPKAEGLEVATAGAGRSRPCSRPSRTACRARSPKRPGAPG